MMAPTPIASIRWPDGLNVLVNEPMAAHTYFGIGGPADFFVEVGGLPQLEKLLDFCRDSGVERTILGDGSNVLVGDRGVRGLVIRNACRGIETAERRGVKAESGALMGGLARWCAARGLAGMEFGVGIPGTVGGSVFGNAGCFGTEVKDVFRSATVWLPDGVAELGADRLAFGYRTSALQTTLERSVVLAATFGCRDGDPAAIESLMTDLSRRRRSSQPSARSAGSVFRNPPGEVAGRLIDEAGLKGRRRGGATISEKHANFIVNEGGATAADVMALIGEARDAVMARSGVMLHLEIRPLGEGFEEGCEAPP